MQQYFGEEKKGNLIKLNEKDFNLKIARNISDNFNHIKNVMRMKENEEVFVVLKNKRYLCSMNEDLKSVTIKEEIQTKMKRNEIILYVPFLQDEKISLILQKGTELGVTEFIIVDFEHSKYKLDEEKKLKKLERWNNITLIRPDPQIIWNKKTNPELWNRADATYNRSSSGGGEWRYNKKIQK